jgi:hypothetical protein
MTTAHTPTIDSIEIPDPTPQLTRHDLVTMTAEQIVAARGAGQLDAILGRAPSSSLDEGPPGASESDPPRRIIPGVPQGARPDMNRGQVRRSDLPSMTAAEIMQARSEGRLERMMGDPTW